MPDIVSPEQKQELIDWLLTIARKGLDFAEAEVPETLRQAMAYWALHEGLQVVTAGLGVVAASYVWACIAKRVRNNGEEARDKEVSLLITNAIGGVFIGTLILLMLWEVADIVRITIAPNLYLLEKLGVL